MTATTDTMALARDERADLAELLATLSPEQWDAPTLCEGWRVREVVAHVYSYEDLGVARLAGRMARAGFSVDRANAAGVAEYAGTDPTELVARARAHVQPSGLTAMMGGRIALADGMIHQQDIRRPLGLGREIPADRLSVALEFARTAPPIGARRRIAGLRVVATDLGWAAGDGPSVEGPGEAVLMAMAGRRGVVDELSGPGASTLRERRHQRTMTGSFTPMWIASVPTIAQASAKCVSRKRNGHGYHWNVFARPVASSTNAAATSRAIIARSRRPATERTGGQAKSSG